MAKMRPQTPPREDPSDDEVVLSADAGNLVPEQMGGLQAVQDVEFEEIEEKRRKEAARSRRSSQLEVANVQARERGMR